MISKTYHTLFLREPYGWVAVFGDYSRKVVRQERDDLRDGNEGRYALKDTCILEHLDTNESLFSTLANLNAGA